MVNISAVSNSFSKNNSFANMDFTKKSIVSAAPYYYNEERAKMSDLKEDKLLPDTFATNFKIAMHKGTNALTVYPSKGFKGSKNSNFYEYLTMGMFPYLMGSLTFIALFNGASKYFAPRCASAAKKYGFGMALGVIFYGVAKELSKKLISTPVKMKTGIDMDRPYQKVVNLIPEGKTKDDDDKKSAGKDGLKKDDNVAIEFHKTFESVDFPRTDLLYNTKDPKKRNEYYDKIAEKNGFGTNLPDSDQEVKPFMKEVVVKTKTAQTLSQYLWAAVGVGLGVQEPWVDMLKIPARKVSGLSIGKHLVMTAKKFGESFVASCKTFYNGGTKGAINKAARYTGRTLLGLAVLTTVLGVINAVRNPYIKNDKNMNSGNVFDDSRKVQEG